MTRLFNAFYTQLFLTSRFFLLWALVVFVFLLAFFFPVLGLVAYTALLTAVSLVLLDLFLLYRQKHGVFATRIAPERLSNGDDNEIRIYIENRYPFRITAGIIDEIPVQFQRRDIWFPVTLDTGAHKTIQYQLRPVKRGEYAFGQLRLYISSAFGLIQRRYDAGTPQTLPVYPSFIHMRKYDLLAASNRLTDYGLKRMRRIGHSMEFEQIKSYVAGDDYRTLNWKATARQGQLMVNSYVDEKAQHVYCIIDKSRSMRMPFNGMSLLDYAINASLALSKVAMLREDKAGLLTISDKQGASVMADRKSGQLNTIMETLYNEKTRYLETNWELLYRRVRHTIKQRSLIVLFTNFESMPAMRRQLPLLKRIAHFHLLVVVFFENTELANVSATAAADAEDVYFKTITTKFTFEKRQIVRELNLHGIQSVLTAPENLTVSTINKYLEIKARHLL